MMIFAKFASELHEMLELRHDELDAIGFEIHCTKSKIIDRKSAEVGRWQKNVERVKSNKNRSKNSRIQKCKSDLSRCDNPASLRPAAPCAGADSQSNPLEERRSKLPLCNPNVRYTVSIRVHAVERTMNEKYMNTNERIYMN